MFLCSFNMYERIALLSRLPMVMFSFLLPEKAFYPEGTPPRGHSHAKGLSQGVPCTFGAV